MNQEHDFTPLTAEDMARVESLSLRSIERHRKYLQSVTRESFVEQARAKLRQHDSSKPFTVDDLQLIVIPDFNHLLSDDDIRFVQAVGKEASELPIPLYRYYLQRSAAVTPLVIQEFKEKIGAAGLDEAIVGLIAEELGDAAVHQLTMSMFGPDVFDDEPPAEDTPSSKEG